MRLLGGTERGGDCGRASDTRRRPGAAPLDGRPRRGLRARTIRLGCDRPADVEAVSGPAMTRTILVTPNLTGADGISAVARLVARAVDDVTILALHEPAAITRFEHAAVLGAAGRSSRFIAAAVRQAALADARTTVVTNHVH